MVTYAMLKDVAQGIRELVFPDNCFICRCFLDSGHTRQLCAACLSKIPRNIPPFCGFCCRHLETYTDDGLCRGCRGQVRHYDRAWGAALYTAELPQLLHAFKYNAKTGLRKTFGGLINEFIGTYHVPLAQFDAVVPVPLHPVRLRERGFNQAALLSQDLAAHHGLSHQPHALVRTHPTDSQTALDQKQRWTNLRGAFRINPSEVVAEKSVLLVDDLLTTGATADAAAAALKKAGAVYVGVLTLAIT